MPQLTVTISPSIAEMTRSTAELAFTSTLNSAPDLRIDVDSLAYMGPHSIVYRANLAGLNVVLKFSTNEQSFEDLTREADVYQGPLAPVQGSLIPRFHGYYKNERQGCLILEDCGKPAAYLSFSELSREERKKILHVLTEFHRLTGLHPDDFAERNVVCMDGKYKLIDFHELIEHECHPGLVVQMRWPTDMVCTHLSVAVIDMDLLPDDSTSARTYPVLANHARFSQISAGYYRQCAVSCPELPSQAHHRCTTT
ncbi:uncharacterized protein EV420DRAFT_1117954 [Desarmillaria tabescens]|uniref:Uncharacterized protein n=1 Tax=Armillaria tabescens TaxID=1929756 RepID=A0AA39TUL6_ARMTA|nr:uncharacterized protein EV420DRAFT_1117954 [Desarmillaria tabescens]KAK0463979.1 hypothetical protein EV420DRAFT_1117954 [Desarmillaria tabescens]